MQLLIERGCQYSAKNNEGFTASDYAYSSVVFFPTGTRHRRCFDLTSCWNRVSTRDTLQDAARTQFENNKRARRHVFAQAAQKGTERAHHDGAMPPPKVPRRKGTGSPRLRSGSGASRMTGGTTSESEMEGPSSLLHGHYTSNSPMSSPSARSTNLPSAGSIPPPYNQTYAGSTSAFSTQSFPMSSGLSTTQSTLSPIATRMLERDADAMEKYKRRNRSGSGGTTSTDALSQAESMGYLNGADFEEFIPPMNSLVNGSVQPRRLLRPSASAAQLRSNGNGFGLVSKASQEMLRSRSGTNPMEIHPSGSSSSFSTINGNHQTNGSSNATTPTRSKPGAPNRALSSGMADDKDGDYTGPSELYAQFPPPTATPRLPPQTKTPTKGTDRNGKAPSTTAHRRIPFHILSKPLPPIDAQLGHRRGTSTT